MFGIATNFVIQQENVFKLKLFAELYLQLKFVHKNWIFHCIRTEAFFSYMQQG